MLPWEEEKLKSANLLAIIQDGSSGRDERSTSIVWNRGLQRLFGPAIDDDFGTKSLACPAVPVRDGVATASPRGLRPAV